MHLDMDTFFVSVERLNNSFLKDKPVLIGHDGNRGVVASCSYEARKFGVHSAMPIKLAKELCPEAVILRGNHADYTKYSEMVSEIIRETVPIYEKSSVDEFYVDLTGMDKFFGCLQLASELRQNITKETGLPVSFGLSQNKTVSKVATGEAKPNNQKKIDHGREKAFLAPLSVKKIPMIGAKTYQTLAALGIRRVKMLQEMPVELLEKVFGKNGIVMWKKANGIDNSRVEPYSERKSISSERTFGQDTTDNKHLKTIILTMTEHLAYQLRKDDMLTACVAVKVRYSDFNTHTLQAKIPYTSADHTLIPKALELFERLFDKRLLVRLVGVRLSHLVHGNYQINLFDDTEEMISLYQAMDHIRKKHGDQKVLKAAALGVDAVRSFNPFKGQIIST